jgi:ADP-L-glycero-D-manno-heptose 6-epimerase
MNKEAKIIVTGAAGFIGSCMVQYLNNKGYHNIIMVDDFGVEEKRQNWSSKEYTDIVERISLFEWLERQNATIDCFIHLGARTDTTEFNYEIHKVLNVEYSKNVWKYCTEKNVPLIYASSAATYGAGELGYNDDHETPFQLQPLNPYGVSKNEFDKWALQQNSAPTFWAGLKFFNVYGPNEYHKGRMASVIWHSFNQIKKNGFVNLFKSHRPDFEDGQQLRDFIYVKDLIQVIFWMMEESFKLNNSIHQENQRKNKSEFALHNGLYNLGTGKARSFEDLVKATFAGLNLAPNIKFIDMPIDIRDKYQYFTEANMEKLFKAGYTQSFYSLEEGVGDYVSNYLNKGLKKY